MLMQIWITMQDRNSVRILAALVEVCRLQMLLVMIVIMTSMQRINDCWHERRFSSLGPTGTMSMIQRGMNTHWRHSASSCQSEGRC